MPVIQLTEARKQHAIIHYVPTNTPLVAAAEKFWNDPRVKQAAVDCGIGSIDAVVKSKVKALQ